MSDDPLPALLLTPIVADAAVIWQVSLFSQPNPSPSGSLAVNAHAGYAPVADEAPEFELAPTWQVLLFSQPKPSPSGSLLVDWQAGHAEPVPDALLLTLPVATTQEVLFSQPKPSPSESLAAELQVGSAASACGLAISVQSASKAVPAVHLIGFKLIPLKILGE